MTFNVKRRGRVAYYYQGDSPTISSLVTEDLGEGDVKIYFAGLTGGKAASYELYSVGLHQKSLHG